MTLKTLTPAQADVLKALGADKEKIDALARKWAVCDGLEDLLSPGDGPVPYRPSLYPGRYATREDIEELRTLCDAYDAAQESRGDPRRACRGPKEWWEVRPARKATTPKSTTPKSRGRKAQLDLSDIPALQAGARAALATLRGTP